VVFNFGRLGNCSILAGNCAGSAQLPAKMLQLQENLKNIAGIFFLYSV
jgi:hypothetical protein